MAPSSRDPHRTDLDQLLTTARLADRFNLPVKRLRLAIRTGQLPAFKLGAWTRVRLRDAEEWLERHRLVPPEI